MPATAIRIPRPGPDEHLPYFSKYTVLVPGEDAYTLLQSGIERTTAMLGGLDESQASFRYAPGKWSVKQVVGHLSDVERVFAYRALVAARGDRTPLPSFDENEYAEAGDFDQRPIAEIVAEFRAVRAASLALFGSLGPEALARRGNANGATITPRAVAWIAAGHELHHVAILRERYRLGG